MSALEHEAAWAFAINKLLIEKFSFAIILSEDASSAVPLIALSDPSIDSCRGSLGVAELPKLWSSVFLSLQLEMFKINNSPKIDFFIFLYLPKMLDDIFRKKFCCYEE
jgi:hypothetical protein